MANVIIGIFIAMVTGRLTELRYYLRIFRVLFSQFIYLLFFYLSFGGHQMLYCKSLKTFNKKCFIKQSEKNGDNSPFGSKGYALPYVLER